MRVWPALEATGRTHARVAKCHARLRLFRDAENITVWPVLRWRPGAPNKA